MSAFYGTAVEGIKVLESMDANEPVSILRGADPLAASMVEHYGVTVLFYYDDYEQRTEAINHARKMREWSRRKEGSPCS